jgi:hypothetical protein
MRSALIKVYDLTVVDRVDRDGITSQEVAKTMAENARKAFGLIADDSPFEKVAILSLDGYGLFRKLQQTVASYSFALDLVADRVAFGTEQQLNDSLRQAEEKRVEIKEAMKAMCDYAGIYD